MNIYRGMKNLYSDVYYHFNDSESLPEGPLKNIPNDVLLLILSQLCFETILKLSLVNKNWKIASDDPALLKYVIYRDKLMNPYQFNRYFGYQLEVSERQKAWEALPNNIGQTFKGCSKFPNKKLGETYLFVLIPKNATIKNIGKLLNGKFVSEFNRDVKNDYHFIDPEIYEIFGDEPIQESTWIAIDLDPRLKRKPWLRCCEAVLDIQSWEYRKPKIVEAIICLSLIYFKSKTVQLKKAYCEENLNGQQVLVKLHVDYLPFHTRTIEVVQGISVTK